MHFHLSDTVLYGKVTMISYMSSICKAVTDGSIYRYCNYMAPIISKSTNTLHKTRN